nr:TetR/AcrR family transcriptional regulator [Azospirillum doebereinerae]
MNCAARLFRMQGYAAVNLRNIAKSIGMTTGSLYYHFSSKEQIVREILEQGHQRVLVEVKKAVEMRGSEHSVESIRIGILTHITCLLGEDSFPAANVRIFSHVPREIQMSTLEARHRYEIYWEHILRDCQKQGVIRADLDPHVLALLLFGAMNWTLEWFNPGRHTIEAIASDLTKLLLSGNITGQVPGAPEKAARKAAPKKKQHGA